MNGNEYGCDRCGDHVPDGDGNYEENGDRVCSACYHNVPSEPVH